MVGKHDGRHLTIHMLDTTGGKQAARMHDMLSPLEAGGDITDVRANVNARCVAPRLAGCASPGRRKFHAHLRGDYLRREHAKLPDPSLLDEIPTHLGISDANAHCHAPVPSARAAA